MLLGFLKENRIQKENIVMNDSTDSRDVSYDIWKFCLRGISIMKGV